MKELLCYLWKHRLSGTRFTTTQGEEVTVEDVGARSTTDGPEFLHAKVKLGDKLWAGSVQIDLRADDNRPPGEPADNVILRVVGAGERLITRQGSETIPQLLLITPMSLRRQYAYLTREESGVACRQQLSQVPALYLRDWVSALAIERLQHKSERILRWLELYQGGWQEVCYLLLARTLGFGINSDAFEALARSVPLIFLQKHANSLFQVEALLLGQSGLLDDASHPENTHKQRLTTEYLFLKHKFGLTPLAPEVWRLSRTRPANLPHQRIAMLAQYIHQGFSLFTSLLNTPDQASVRALFQVRLSGYWDTHYTWGDASPLRDKVLGDGAVDILLINTVAPLLYAYGSSTGNDSYMDRSMQLLEETRAERNALVTLFDSTPMHAKSALESQALIQLRNSYCTPHRCLDCRIGFQLLRHWERDEKIQK